MSKLSLSINRQYIDGPFGQIHIAETQEVNPSQPSVLLLHQTPRSVDEFKEVMEILAGKYHLIAMDLPGMGASGKPPSATIENYALAANCVMAHFSSSQNMIVCGHHTGGVVAIEVAARNPDNVVSLVLSSTPWVDEEARNYRATKEPIDTVNRVIDGSHLASLWQQRSPYYPDSTEYLDRFIRDALIAANPADGHHAVGQYRMEDRVSDIHVPVLVIEHSKDPFASRHTKLLCEQFNDVCIEKIAGGHIPLEHTAREFSDILENWIKQTRNAVEGVSTPCTR